jgi:PAS domain S-box-containing protein
MLVRAGAGFPDGVLDGVLPAHPSELPGFTLAAGEPVAVEDFAAEDRCKRTSLQRDLGVIGALAAPIESSGSPFGTIAVHCRAPRRFTEDDMAFLSALGNVVGLAVDRERGDDRVRDSEARFRELADTTPALMWMTDPDGHLTFVNEGWLRHTGYTLLEEIGDTFGMSAHPDDRPDLVARWREAIARREEFRFEYRLRDAARGDWRWVLEIGIPRFSDGEFVGYVGTATDIHERRMMEEALRESEAGFRDLADSAPVMIWTTDLKGHVTFVNEGWMRFTGTSLDEELGDSWALGVHPDDVGGMIAAWDQSLSERSSFEYEYRLRAQDGEYRWIADHGVPRYERGVFAGFVGTAVDIHERKLMEGRLRAVYEREHTIAETLQRSLLPERLPQVEAMELAARYLPAGHGSAIGGDWYDVLERQDGRVALVVGDVVGHGLRAAATMGQLRNAFRAYGLVEGSPAEVMARINRLVLSGVEDAMATVLYVVLDRETGELAFTAAGHPPPLVVSPDGARFLEGGRSVPIGATDPAVFRESRELLPPGAALLLYTDGLVERRDVPIERRLDELAAAAARAGGDLDALCDGVLAGVLGDAEPVDDVALLAVRPVPTAADRLEMTLRAEPESLAILRRRLARFLHAAGASELEQYEITLTVCEAAGNAIEHAYGPGDATFDISVACEEDGLWAEVRDRGRWRERRGDHRGRGLKIMDGLMDEVDVSAESTGTVITMRRRLSAVRVS